jgi:hypothetical protein
LLASSGSGRNKISAPAAMRPIHCQRILDESKPFKVAAKDAGFILGTTLIYWRHVGWAILAKGLVD